MSYCNLGDHPIISYNFKNGSTSSYVSAVAPIDVEISCYIPKLKGGQCPILYNIKVSYDGGPPQGFIDARFYGPLLGGKMVVFSEYSYTFNAVLSSFSIQLLVGGTNYEGIFPTPKWIGIAGGQGGTYTTYPVEIVSAIPVDPSQPNSCGNPLPQNTIEVKHNGLTIFKDIGNAPCTFTVQCKDCPPGTVKCNSPGYPGYCCIPCDSMAQRINNLASKL